MVNLPEAFREKVERLERNFNVSTVIFKKFSPIWLDIFGDPSNDPPKQPRSRKQRLVLQITTPLLVQQCISLLKSVEIQNIYLIYLQKK